MHCRPKACPSMYKSTKAASGKGSIIVEGQAMEWCGFLEHVTPEEVVMYIWYQWSEGNPIYWYQ